MKYNIIIAAILFCIICGLAADTNDEHYFEKVENLRKLSINDQLPLENRIDFANLALEFVQENGDKISEFNIQLNLADLYYEQNDQERSIYHYQKCIALREWLHSEKVDRIISELNAKYKKEKALGKKQIIIRNLFLFFFIILFNFVIVLFIRNYLRKKHIEKLTLAHNNLKEIATRDPLTKLPNRHETLEKLENEKYRFQRNKNEFSIVICDIDHFKIFNDKYGHDCGDYILEEIAKIFIESLRKQDVVGRWGGEEFLFLLPETPLEGCRLVTKKIREKIEEHVFKYKDLKLFVTMTFGFSVYHSNMGINNCIKQADIALYEGKSQGRNCTVAYEDTV